MNSTERQRVRRQRLKEQGLCTQCGKVPPREDRTTCETCGNKLSKAMSKWQKKAKKERQGKGLCSCGRPAPQGKKTCEECNEKNKAWYYRRKELGLCSYCGNDIKDGTTRCNECSRKLSEQKQELKREVMEAYGGPTCACCGETTETFLTIDHINNDGAKHRRIIGRTSVNKWLKNNGFPTGYQVLCFNCNMGKHLNGGICPHQEQNG